MTTRYLSNIYDPALGVNEGWQGSSGYVDEVFRYYYTPACENNSPPSDPPGTWNWSADEIPTMPSPTWNTQRTRNHDNCLFPR